MESTYRLCAFMLRRRSLRTTTTNAITTQPRAESTCAAKPRPQTLERASLIAPRFVVGAEEGFAPNSRMYLTWDSSNRLPNLDHRQREAALVVCTGLSAQWVRRMLRSACCGHCGLSCECIILVSSTCLLHFTMQPPNRLYWLNLCTFSHCIRALRFILFKAPPLV